MNDDIKNGLIGFAAMIGLSILAFIIMETDGAELAYLRNSGLETTAVVVEIREPSGLRTAGQSTIIFVRYTVNEVSYTNRLQIGSRHAYMGREVAILYNPGNPNQITARDSNISNYELEGSGWYVIVFGGIIIFTICCSWVLIRGIRTKRKEAVS